VIDFNVRHSITRLGKKDVYVLKPRLRLVPRIVSGAVSGTVLEEGTGLPLEGATVSAQQEGEEIASVKCGADGSFRISPLRAGAYDLVVTADGHAIGVETGVEITARQENPDHDFDLAIAGAGDIQGTAPAGEGFLVVLRFGGHFIAQAAADPDTQDFEFPGVPEGTYDVALLENGVQADIVEEVPVTAGALTDGIVLAAP
jgi:hypothetical protein